MILNESLYNIYFAQFLSLLLAIMIAVFLYPLSSLAVLHFKNILQDRTTYERYHGTSVSNKKQSEEVIERILTDEESIKA